MGDFSVDIAKFAQKSRGNADTVIRKTVLDIGRSLIEKTPVGNPEFWQNPQAAPPGYVGGHARANWVHSINSLDAREIDDVDASDGEQNTAYKNMSGSLLLKGRGDKDTVHFISNSVPYIQALEDGHSQQAPNGMVALTVTEFKDYIQQELAALK